MLKKKFDSTDPKHGMTPLKAKCKSSHKLHEKEYESSKLLHAMVYRITQRRYNKSVTKDQRFKYELFFIVHLHDEFVLERTLSRIVTFYI